MLQNAVKNATPSSKPQRAPSNIPYEIKRLIAEKRKARSTWQRTHTPDNKRIYNQISNKLKSKLRELRNELFKAYVSSLKREDSSIWKPIKTGENRPNHNLQYAKILHPRDLGQKATRKKLTYLWNTSQKCSLHKTTTKIKKWNKS